MIFFLHEAPDSIQLLFDSLLREGVITGPRLNERIPLRTWHIHHIREHTCWHSRIVFLKGHWNTWFAAVLERWNDRNDPNEDTILSVVFPDPPRSGVQHEI